MTAAWVDGTGPAGLFLGFACLFAGVVCPVVVVFWVLSAVNPRNRRRRDADE